MPILLVFTKHNNLNFNKLQITEGQEDCVKTNNKVN